MDMFKMLKSCPFCGGEAKLHLTSRFNQAYYEAWVQCEWCGASICKVGRTRKSRKSEEIVKISAIARWNSRVNPAQEPTISKENW